MWNECILEKTEEYSLIYSAVIALVEESFFEALQFVKRRISLVGVYK